MIEEPKAKTAKEEKYIQSRKRKAFFSSLLFYVCRIFPVNKKLISVCTFEGKGGFGCNQKYIVEELHKRNAEYKFVWFVNKDIYDKKEFPSYIKKVPNTLLQRAFWLSCSKIWIDNYRKPYGTVKRKNQYYVNTWHATMGFKTIGLLRGDAFSKMAFLVSQNDSKMINDVVVDTDYCEVMYKKGLVYDGTFLKVGQARCDVLYGERKEQKLKFRQKHNLPEDCKVVMFAPTFREGSQNGKRFVFSEVWTIDFERLLKTLEKKFGNKWYLCVRVHPQLAPSFKEYKNPSVQNRIIDESQADDMYEILAGMDAFITDYSSAAFDAGNAKIPVFIYADDINKYSNDRGSLLWQLCENTQDDVHNNPNVEPKQDMILPFLVAKNNDELEERILSFDNDVYCTKLNAMHKTVNLVFNGNASKLISDKIVSRMEN